MCMKKRKLFVTTMLAMSMVISSSIVTSAASSSGTSSTSSIFSVKSINKCLSEIAKSPLYSDVKNGTKIVPTSSTNLTKLSSTSTGTYPTRKGVILVTGDAYKGLLPTGHAAIVYSSNTVVESLSNGVTTGKNNWYQTKETCYGASTYGTSAQNDITVANWCYGKIGTPYNYNYFNTSTRKKFYCSQLVYAGYLDNYNINLNTSLFGGAVHPLELIQSDETYLIYKQN